MALGHSLPPPTPLDIHDQNAMEKWKKFNLAWNSYALATELDTKSEGVQVATLLTVIGEEARDVYSTILTGPMKGKKTRLPRCYRSLLSIASHERMYHSSAIDLIVEHKKQEKAMTSTGPHFVSLQRAVTLT